MRRTRRDARLWLWKNAVHVIGQADDEVSGDTVQTQPRSAVQLPAQLHVHRVQCGFVSVEGEWRQGLCGEYTVRIEHTFTEYAVCEYVKL